MNYLIEVFKNSSLSMGKDRFDLNSKMNGNTCSIKEILLDNNTFSIQGISNISDFVKENRSTMTLSMSNNSIDTLGYQKLKSSIASK